MVNWQNIMYIHYYYLIQSPEIQTLDRMAKLLSKFVN